MNFSNLRTISLDRVITILSKDGGVEIKTTTCEGEEIRLNELTQFTLHDHVSIYTYRNEHYFYKIDFFFDVFMHFELC